ncbi:hypothetical protein MNBD_DELTA03-1642, partial [hydrothermal vent metagenome]
KEVGDSLHAGTQEPEKILIKRMKALDLKSGGLKDRTGIGRLYVSCKSDV